MFKIRPKQQASLADKAFVDWVENYLAEDMLERKVSAEERARLPFRGMIEHGMEVARGYGLETQRDLMFFVLNMITINPEFHRQPKIHAILEDESLTTKDRRDKLLTDVSKEEWEEAAQMTDEDAYWSRVLPAA
jgi:hypothetical protein